MDRITSPTLPYWLAAIYVPQVTPRKLLQWVESVGSIQDLFASSTEQLQRFGCTPAQIQAFHVPNWRQVEVDLVWGEGADQHLIAWDDPRYPARLKHIPNPPFHLFVKGDPALLATPQLAIVGARQATPRGLYHAERFAAALVKTGLTVTSGMARGIDGAAHRGALRAQGKTIGVAGRGLHDIYPAAHRDLAREMVQAGGALVSEFPLKSPPQTFHFPYRNRIISGLSLGVLVVEAALKSGSLVTARHALEQNREIFAIPQAIGEPLARGCHYLIREGAKLVEQVTDILEELKGFQYDGPPVDEEIATSARVPSEYRSIFDHIGDAVTSIETLVLRSGLTSREVSSMLLKLELDGYIQAVTGGYRRMH
jgi:DNA processing protein